MFKMKIYYFHDDSIQQIQFPAGNVKIQIELQMI